MLLGIDGADPVFMKSLMEADRLPNIQKLADMGAAHTNYEMLGAMPTITPPCWSTLGNGAYPGTHGITCFWTHFRGRALDEIEFGMNSRIVKAETIWDLYARNGHKVLVYHYPTAWPPSEDPEVLKNIIMVDGTCPETPFFTAQVDYEKVVEADENSDLKSPKFTACEVDESGAGCFMTEEISHDKGNTSLKMTSLVLSNEDGIDGENGASGKHDLVETAIKPATGWAAAPEGAKEFAIIVNKGDTRRYGLILPNEKGEYDRVAIYRRKKDTEPMVVVNTTDWSECVHDVYIQDDKDVRIGRYYRIINLSPDGSKLRLYIGYAVNLDDFHLIYPEEVGQELFDKFGVIPFISHSTLHDKELAQIVLESWVRQARWHAQTMKYLIDKYNPSLVYTHLHSVDLMGHLFTRNLRPRYEGNEFFRELMAKSYELSDEWLGEFLPYLEDGKTSIVLVSDHGLTAGEEEPPLLGDAWGINAGIMSELGYVGLNFDEKGNASIDWSKTTAVAQRSGYIYINLKGRDPEGIVEPADYDQLVTKIIDDLYNYRDKETGKRIVSFALRAQDMPIIGLGGENCGDIYYTLEPDFNRIHGDSTPSCGTHGTSVMSIFIAAGAGIKENHRTERVIRQVDIVPTIAELMEGPVPAHCEGGTLYQILKKHQRD